MRYMKNMVSIRDFNPRHFEMWERLSKIMNSRMKKHRVFVMCEPLGAPRIMYFCLEHSSKREFDPDVFETIKLALIGFDDKFIIQNSLRYS